MKKVKQPKHCGLPIQSFTFSDGSVIRKCSFTYCKRFDEERQRVLAAPMGKELLVVIPRKVVR